MDISKQLLEKFKSHKHQLRAIEDEIAIALAAAAEYAIESGAIRNYSGKALDIFVEEVSLGFRKQRGGDELISLNNAPVDFYSRFIEAGKTTERKLKELGQQVEANDRWMCEISERFDTFAEWFDREVNSVWLYPKPKKPVPFWPGWKPMVEKDKLNYIFFGSNERPLAALVAVPFREDGLRIAIWRYEADDVTEDETAKKIAQWLCDWITNCYGIEPRQGNATDPYETVAINSVKKNKAHSVKRGNRGPNENDRIRTTLAVWAQRTKGITKAQAAASLNIDPDTITNHIKKDWLYSEIEFMRFGDSEELWDLYTSEMRKI